MMAMLVDGILAVGMMCPHRVCQELQLIALGPARDLAGKVLVLTDHFLEKNHARLAVSQTIAYVLQSKTPLAGRKSFVDVKSKYAKISRGHVANVTKRQVSGLSWVNSYNRGLN